MGWCRLCDGLPTSTVRTKSDGLPACPESNGPASAAIASPRLWPIDRRHRRSSYVEALRNVGHDWTGDRVSGVCGRSRSASGRPCRRRQPHLGTPIRSVAVTRSWDFDGSVGSGDRYHGALGRTAVVGELIASRTGGRVATLQLSVVTVAGADLRPALQPPRRQPEPGLQCRAEKRTTRASSRSARGVMSSRRPSPAALDGNRELRLFQPLMPARSSDDRERSPAAPCGSRASSA